MIHPLTRMISCFIHSMFCLSPVSLLLMLQLIYIDNIWLLVHECCEVRSQFNSHLMEKHVVLATTAWVMKCSSNRGYMLWPVPQQILFEHSCLVAMSRFEFNRVDFCSVCVGRRPVWQRTTVQLPTIPRANKKPLIDLHGASRAWYSRSALSIRIM